VTRDPPRTLRVEVVERTPIAMLINVQSCDWLLDEDGVVLPAAQGITVHDLPVITGVGDVATALTPGVRIVHRRVLQGLQALKAIRSIDPRLLHLFSEISLEHARDLVLYTMEGGVPVILGSPERLSEKMQAFRTFWENVAMKYDPASLEYVDLRWKEQVVTRWRDAGSTPPGGSPVDSLTAAEPLVTLRDTIVPSPVPAGIIE
jgi:cell division septal protein FtsQ